MSRYLFLLTLALAFVPGLTQNTPFGIYLEPVNISNLGGVQAYAFGQHAGKWLIVGGRLDGLHRRQPWASFDAAGNNTQLLVIDPVAQQKWTAPLTALPVAQQEQLSSTNMEFHQDGDYLYVIGGYGFSATLGDHKTYDLLTAIDVPSVISAVINGTSIAPHFRYISNPAFAVTGGHLKKVYNTWYLVGGNRFDGAYNPMGNPTYTQVYTNEIRKFLLNDDGTNLQLTLLPAVNDSAHLHRRDFNVVPQIMPGGQEGLTAFSGVFQTTVDLPYLDCVNIDSSGYVPNNSFAQYYNHYHCAVLPLYSESANEMHSVFFGGIAQYYDSVNVLVQDNNCPFVSTIARVTRDNAGNMAEYKLPVSMPALLGASAEFIPLQSIPAFANEVMKLDSMTADTTLVGHIYGGISSTAANIFWVNDGTQSSASSQIFRVYVIRNTSTGIHQLNMQSNGSLRMQVFPNPNRGWFYVGFTLKKKEPVRLTIFDERGRKVAEETLTDLAEGPNSVHKKIRHLEKGGVFLITLETSTEKAVQKVIVDP